jgi:hypothetical protein
MEHRLQHSIDSNQAKEARELLLSIVYKGNSFYIAGIIGLG